MPELRTFPYDCDFCGKMVRLTNWMRRYAVTPEGALVYTDTHMLTHTQAIALPHEDVRFAQSLSDEERKRRFYEPSRNSERREAAQS